eukprot:g2719.t1
MPSETKENDSKVAGKENTPDTAEGGNGSGSKEEQAAAKGDIPKVYHMKTGEHEEGPTFDENAGKNKKKAAYIAPLSFLANPTPLGTPLGYFILLLCLVIAWAFEIAATTVCQFYFYQPVSTPNVPLNFGTNVFMGLFRYIDPANPSQCLPIPFDYFPDNLRDPVMAGQAFSVLTMIFGGSAVVLLLLHYCIDISRKKDSPFPAKYFRLALYIACMAASVFSILVFSVFSRPIQDPISQNAQGTSATLSGPKTFEYGAGLQIISVFFYLVSAILSFFATAVMKDRDGDADAADAEKAAADAEQKALADQARELEEQKKLKEDEESQKKKEEENKQGTLGGVPFLSLTGGSSSATNDQSGGGVTGYIMSLITPTPKGKAQQFFQEEEEKTKATPSADATKGDTTTVGGADNEQHETPKEEDKGESKESSNNKNMSNKSEDVGGEKD